jgi:hypothetical protein
MNLILVKMFATALSLAQVTTQPNAVKTHFDPITDQAEVVQLLKNGCAHMRKAFDIEDLNLDDLIETALQDPQTIAGEIKAFRGINFDDLHIAYRQFCGKGDVSNSPFNIAEVIDFYNNAVVELPDHNKLKGLKLPGTSVVMDGKGEKFAELFESDHRRTWVPLSQMPEHVKAAFIAAEDKRFYQHKGVDERGLIRAFISNIAQPGRPQGGSTITQQVAKNLLVGDDVSYERKIREMIVAARIDQGRGARGLSQLDLPGPQLLGHRHGRAHLLQEAGLRAVRDRRGRARKPCQGPRVFQPGSLSGTLARTLSLRDQADAGGENPRHRG